MFNSTSSKMKSSPKSSRKLSENVINYGKNSLKAMAVVAVWEIGKKGKDLVAGMFVAKSTEE